MNTMQSPLAELAPHFERLCELPEPQRSQLLASLPLDADQRARLAAMLAADARGDDRLDRLISEGAARLQAGGVGAHDDFGPWRPLRELGAGGMGTVLLAERADGQFQREVAIKLLRGFPTHDAIRRLRHERQILASLDHPNIARLLDGGETAQGQPWLVIEYVPGQRLLDHVLMRRLGLAQRLDLFDAMLDAVAHAHSHLVVHRDLKPANVMVTPDGAVKLLDFGIARLVDAGTDPVHETSTRVFSRGYASPEQEAGGTITTASDIYSLGVLLRELLSGHRGEPSSDLPVVPPVTVGAELAGIIAKATAREPAQRYASVGELRDDLHRFRQGRPVRAARWTRRYRLRKFIGRHRGAVATALLALVVAAAFVWRLAHERTLARQAQAVAQHAQAASERDARRARASLEFLRAAFAAVTPQVAMNRQVSIRDLLDAASHELAQRDDAVLVQSMQRLLASLYAELGESVRAAELMRAGLQGLVPGDRAEALELAVDLDTLANQRGITGDIAGARAAAQQAAQWRERFAPGERSERARSLANLANIEHRDGKDEAAIPLLREALGSASETAALPLELHVDIAQSLASLSATAGDPALALAVADAALARLAAQRPKDAPSRVALLLAKAVALRTSGDANAAATLLREAIALHARVIDPGGVRMMYLTNELALALNDLGRYREAAEQLARSERFRLDAGIHGTQDEAIGLLNRAGVLESAGDYASAKPLYREALAMFDQAGLAADHQVRRRALRAQARTLGLAGEHARALELLTRLRADSARIDGVDSAEYAMLTWQLAVLARQMHRPDRGLPLLEEVTRRWQALVPPEHPLFLHIHRARAAFAMDLGDLERADQEQAAAVAGFERADTVPVDLAIARSELAGIRLRQGDRAAARRLLQAALPVMRETLLAHEVSRAAAERLAERLGLAGP
ncbi:MAG: serine/threonine protein kinase [Dokdonella sp.]|nr:MAG: serine/threonine protein kinase [Dokdonella sp.]